LETESRHRLFRELPERNVEDSFETGHNRPSGKRADPHRHLSWIRDRGLHYGFLRPALRCGVPRHDTWKFRSHSEVYKKAKTLTAAPFILRNEKFSFEEDTEIIMLKCHGFGRIWDSI
jgi:hypothetical protein